MLLAVLHGVTMMYACILLFVYSGLEFGTGLVGLRGRWRYLGA